MQTDYEKLEFLCWQVLSDRNLNGNEKYEIRLKEELREVKKQEEAKYFLTLKNKEIKSAKNDHNLLIPWLLDICDCVDIEKSPSYTDPEMLDIDCDYHPVIREYLKEKWVPEKYGSQYVCNITSYHTFGIKNSLLDVARVLGEERNEVLAVTKKLGAKDEEGDDLTFETARDICKDLADYLDKHPRIADVTSHLVSADIDWGKFGIKNPPKRKHNMSTHASGLVISGVPLEDYVPMVVASGSRDTCLKASAWVEGLADTDLSSVGFIKFDFLSLEGNSKIASCNKLIRERHNIDKICALPGRSTWSDTSYLNDPKALELANNGDLKGVFQFDSDGIRKLVRTGGVSSFDDLAAYTAIYRPGPMDAGMHEEYCNRKHGKKKFVTPDCVKSFLDKTYGIMVYQEDVMKYLNIVGKIPLHQCQGVIKAISKKKIEKFKKFKDDFVKNCQIVLNVSEKEAIDKWNEVESFAGYGFNLSHAVAYTYISSRQLWQKAHYPLEFFTEDLAHMKTASEKIRIYIDDAKKHGIIVNKIHLNYSDVNFCIVDKDKKRNQKPSENDEIYFGFSKVKEIGDKVAERIVAGQPYDGFIDFLNRFGTDAKAVQALLSLRVFDEADPITLYKFYEIYKDKSKKERDRSGRFDASVDKYKKNLKELVPELEWLTFDEVDFSKARQYVDIARWTAMQSLKKKYDKCIETFKYKTIEAQLKLKNLTLDSFDLNKIEIDKEMENLLTNKEAGELFYYGFEWDHPLTLCENYKGYTWEEVNMNLDITPKVVPVEVLIKSAELSYTKTNKKMLKLRCEDANRTVITVTAWSEECDRFKEELVEGACVRLRVKVDKDKNRDNYWYNLESFHWTERNKIPKNKDNDFRVFVLREAPKKQDKGTYE